MARKIFLTFVLLLNFFITQVAANASDQYKKDFFTNSVQKKIEKNWIVPYSSPNVSTVVSFTVNVDGTISPVAVIRSSQDDKFDKSVVEAVAKASPFETANVTLTEPVKVEFFFSPSFNVANLIETKPEKSHIVYVSDRSNYIDFSDYIDNLQTKINANWTPKPFAKERENILLIKIDKDGALGDISRLKPSHDLWFDVSAIDAINKSVPMDAFPDRIKAPCTNVQLNFHSKRYKLENGEKVSTHFVRASVMNIEGYDKYTAQVDRIFREKLAGFGTIRSKRAIVEAQINRVGKLKYVKILESSGSKLFDRRVIFTLKTAAFPSFPSTIETDSLTLKYEILTGITTGTRIFSKIDK